jgi:hypothetical protein
VARDRIGTPDVKLLIPFERDLMIYYVPRGFLALTGTELVYHRSGEAVVTVAYAEFFRSEIAMTADREFRIGDRTFSLLRSGMSNRHFVDLLHSIKEIVGRGVEAPGRIEPLPADRAIFQRPKWLFAPGSTQEWDEAVREQKARRGQRPTGLESA